MNGQQLTRRYTSVPRHRWLRTCGSIVCLLLAVWAASGCRRTVPIHVWQPAQAAVPQSGRIAIAPIAGQPDLARQLEISLLAQRPPIRADLTLFTPEQLLDSSAVRLASTAALTSDVLSIAAARNAQADVLLQGEILDAKIDLAAATAPEPPPSNWNLAFFRNRDAQTLKDERILMAWRAIDVQSGRTIGTSTFNLGTKTALEKYPDLGVIEQDQTQLLVSASAREAWKTVSPYVTKDQVRLAVPWFQPGAFTVRRGVAAAKKGQWELAEQRWQRVTKIFWFNASAHHNLALAHAAREDFPAAKAQLQKATGPLALRLPSETLVWLDQQHRYHNAALGLGTPIEGWAFPDPQATTPVASVPTVDVATLPWWTALPFAKPPGWTWQGWLTQPWAF